MSRVGATFTGKVASVGAGPLLLLISLMYASNAHAQTLSSPPVAGRIVFTPDEVRISAGCSSERVVRLEDDLVVPIASICDDSTWSKEPARKSECTGRVMAVLAVRFVGSATAVIAQGFSIADQGFHIQLLTALEDAHGPSSQVESVSRVGWCTDRGGPEVAESALPPGSCREPRQFAAAFDYNTPLSNKILTNGFSFYARLAGEPPDGFDLPAVLEDVRSSFGTALTIWMSALKQNDDLLTPRVRAFITSRTSTSQNGYQLLLPPQVVRLACPQAATFVVELNFGSGDTFPDTAGTLMLARARIEGRTIALNLRDVDCFKPILKFGIADKTLPLRDDRCDNLLPILAHELGHAFGLEHVPDSVGIALMNERLSEAGSVPTRIDVAAVVTAFERSVVGAAPGALEFRASDGLLAPKGWTPRERPVSGVKPAKDR